MLSINEISKIALKTEKVRLRLLEVIYNSRSGHVGGDLSVLNMIAALYYHTLKFDIQNPDHENRDRFILSKGHCVEALYCVLESLGFIDSDTLNSYGKFNSLLAGHPSNKIPGIEFSGGSLGHGLSLGVGVAIGAKMDNKDFKTFVVMGDGELNEGAVFEAAMSGGHFKLNNLVAIVDRNGLQISNSTEKVMTLEPLKERWETMGWEVLEVNGDKIEDCIKVLDSINYTIQKPHFIISRTTKGKGVSYMENALHWHHGVPDEVQYKQAVREISRSIEEWEGKIS
ncbi:transketolase [Apibacter raozihei]|uniref:transketolase n=1 Tax=Apibacter raozihei TaxID=2500547 RepID=UPI000FE43A7E|nr:transketolase [Apibacter raozihei]